MLFEGGEPGFLLKAVALLLDDKQPPAAQTREQCTEANLVGWRSLWKHLLREEPPENVSGTSPTVLVIKAWIEQTGKDATIDDLISAFSAIKRNDAANFLLWNLRGFGSQTYYITGHNVVAGKNPIMIINYVVNNYIYIYQ
jgi:hypothetical protein